MASLPWQRYAEKLSDIEGSEDGLLTKSQGGSSPPAYDEDCHMRTAPSWFSHLHPAFRLIESYRTREPHARPRKFSLCARLRSHLRVLLFLGTICSLVIIVKRSDRGVESATELGRVAREKIFGLTVEPYSQNDMESTKVIDPYESIRSLPEWYLEDPGPNDGHSFPPWMSTNIGLVKQESARIAIFDEINAKHLAMRDTCIAESNCSPEQKKIIIVTNRDHHAIVLGDKYGGGETVIARSMEAALKWSNYTVVYHLANTRRLNVIVNEKYGGWQNIHLVIAHHDTFEGCNLEENDCFYSRASNPSGAPPWKILIESLWAGEKEHPLGGDWTLTPEDHRQGGSRNAYAGYSIEDSCLDVPFIDHEFRFGSKTKINAESKTSIGQLEKAIEQGLHKSSSVDLHSRRVAIILAKRMSYFKRPIHAFDYPQFTKAFETLPIRFELGIHNDSQHMDRVPAPEWLLDHEKFENHNLIQPQHFINWLSTASVMVGIGDPKQSPTPYQALCMGVPFINPIRTWDKENPNDRSRWFTQHDGLKYVEPPYVYHVFPNDTVAFVAAIDSALKNPIERFVPSWTTQVEVNQRMYNILHRDYRAIADRVISDRRTGHRFEL